MVRGVKRIGPVVGTNLGEVPGHTALVSSVRDLRVVAETDSAEKKIQRFIELAIRRCGSAAALARELRVKQPTVSQWRAGRKKPDAVHLIQIQNLASEVSVDVEDPHAD